MSVTVRAQPGVACTRLYLGQTSDQQTLVSPWTSASVKADCHLVIVAGRPLAPPNYIYSCRAGVYCFVVLRHCEHFWSGDPKNV